GTLKARGSVTSVVFEPKTGMLSSSSKPRVELWYVESTKLLHTLETPETKVWGQAFNPLSGVLAGGTSRGEVNLWEPLTGELIGKLQAADNGDVNCVAFDPQGSTLASGGG